MKRKNGLVTTLVGAAVVCSAVTITSPAYAAGLRDADWFHSEGNATVQHAQSDGTKGEHFYLTGNEAAAYLQEEADIKAGKITIEEVIARDMKAMQEVEAQNEIYRQINWNVKYGWQQYNNKWYYSADGRNFLRNKWQQINGKWYYFNADHSMAVNTTVDGYYLGADGAWVK